MGSFGLIEVLLAAGVIFLFLSVFPALLKWLWNNTMPDVFGTNEITFWQALRLMIISFLLFGIWMMG